MRNLKKFTHSLHRPAAVAGGALLLSLAALLLMEQHFKVLLIPEFPSVQLHLSGPEQTTSLVNEPLKSANFTKIPILMYHHVGWVPTGTIDSLRSSLTVSPANFAAQVQWLKEQGYNSISLGNLYPFSQKKIPLPSKPIIFTFDDGYDDAFTEAIPILQKYGYSGSFAVITNFPGTVSGTNTYATWQQITQAQQAGMEIVCHSQNHFDGASPKFDAGFIFQNLSGCQQDLVRHLGLAEPFLVYPYGHYTAVYLEQAKKVGFVMGLTVRQGYELNLQNLMELPRIRVSGGENLQRFQDILLGKIDLLHPATAAPDHSPPE